MGELLGVVVGVIKVRSLWFTILILILCVQNAFAVMMEKGKTKVKTLFNFYSQDSKTGKQVLDNSGNEKVKVIEPQIFVKHQITEDTEINASFVLDTWTAESDTILDGNTGASGEGKKGQARVAPNIGVRKESGKASYGLNLGFSSEYDYTSKNVSLDYAHSFKNDNFTIGLGLQYYADTVGLFQSINPPENAIMNKNHNRDIYALSLGASQILTRTDIIEFDATYAKSKGRLESTASTVNIAGVRELEALPGKRERMALTGKWVHAVGEEMSFHLSYRNYFDDWGARAHTVRFAYLFSLRDDQDYLEFAMRLHSQRAVDYYKDSFSASEEFMTSDSDMSKFTSLEPSVMYTRNLGDIKIFGVHLNETEWGTGATYGRRNTGLSYAYLQTSVSFSF